MKSYTETYEAIKKLDPKVAEVYLETGVLVPSDYPVHRIESRKMFTQSMWKSMSCGRRASLKYMDRWKPLKKSIPLELGSLIHKLVPHELMSPGDRNFTDECIKSWSGRQRKHLDRMRRMDVESRWDEDTINESCDLVRSMLRFWRRNRSEIQGVATDVKFRVPVRHPITGHRDPVWDYAGELDGLVFTTASGALFIWELKSTASPNPHDYEQSIEYDPQRWGYPWAVQQVFGCQVGTCYDVLRKKVPSLPSLNRCRKGDCARRRVLWSSPNDLNDAIHQNRESLEGLAQDISELESEIQSLEAEGKAVKAKRKKLEGLEAKKAKLSAWSNELHTVPQEVRLVSGRVIRLDGVSGCPSCGGTGYSAVGTSVTDTTWDLAEEVLGFARANIPGFEMTEDLNKWADRVVDNDTRYSFRLFRLATAEYLAAFGREVYTAAHEWGRLQRLHEKGKPVPTNRGECQAIARQCEFILVCPALNPSAWEKFVQGPAGGVPVELEDNHKEETEELPF